MDYKRILTMQDISCVGQCSLTVALPILSACGLETAILPSAVLSTHSVGFEGFTFHDLTDDIPAIEAHWEKEQIRFDGMYTGYLGSARQIEMVKDIFARLIRPNSPKIVDPAMADRGILYPVFDMNYVEAMKSLTREADIILPNITEAALLTDSEYRESYDASYIDGLITRLHGLTRATVILTGVSWEEHTTGVLVAEYGRPSRYFSHEKLHRSCHGTGDVFASVFTGAYFQGKSSFDAAGIAARFTLRCIQNTMDDPQHWYGVKFEPLLGELIEMLGN